MTSMKVPIALIVGRTPKRICVQIRTGSGCGLSPVVKNDRTKSSKERANTSRPAAMIGRPERGQRHQPEGLPARGAQVHRGVLHLAAERREPRAHHHRHVGDRERDVRQDDRGKRELEPHLREQKQRGGAGHDLRRDERDQHQHVRAVRPARAGAHEPVGQHRAEHGRDDHRDQGDLDARDERVAQRLRLEEGLVPAQAEALEVLQRPARVEREQDRPARSARTGTRRTRPRRP